jgi:hypothetical protein
MKAGFTVPFSLILMSFESPSTSNVDLIFHEKEFGLFSLHGMAGLFPGGRTIWA